MYTNFLINKFNARSPEATYRSTIHIWFSSFVSLLFHPCIRMRAHEKLWQFNGIFFFYAGLQHIQLSNNVWLLANRPESHRYSTQFLLLLLSDITKLMSPIFICARQKIYTHDHNAHNLCHFDQQQNTTQLCTSFSLSTNWNGHLLFYTNTHNVNEMCVFGIFFPL